MSFSLRVYIEWHHKRFVAENESELFAKRYKEHTGRQTKVGVSAFKDLLKETKFETVADV